MAVKIVERRDSNVDAFQEAECAKRAPAECSHSKCENRWDRLMRTPKTSGKPSHSAHKSKYEDVWQSVGNWGGRESSHTKAPRNKSTWRLKVSAGSNERCGVSERVYALAQNELQINVPMLGVKIDKAIWWEPQKIWENPDTLPTSQSLKMF